MHGIPWYLVNKTVVAWLCLTCMHALFFALITCSFFILVVKVKVLTQFVKPKTRYYSVIVQEYFHPLSRPANPISIIQTQSSKDCPCVNLRVTKEYLIAGYFKDSGALFLPSNGALIQRWGNVVHSNVKELVKKVYSR